MKNYSSDIFDRHFRRAFKALFDRDRGHLEFNITALIVRGGKVLSVGFNRHDLREITRSFKSNDWNNTHAEVDAIVRARNKIDLSGSKMYVARMTEYGQIRMARPCEMCQTIISMYGIKRALYTIDDTSFGTMHIRRRQ